MIIVQTPVRISFFGGGTDYPAWYLENGGAVLATTIDKFIYSQCRRPSIYRDYKYRIIYSKMENASKIDDILHPAVREAIRYMNVSEGLEIHHDSDLPARSGLGSSSSFVVGLLQALHGLKGELLDKKTLAKESIHLEQKVLQENVGCQDQIMATYGGFNLINFQTNGNFDVQPMTLKNERFVEFNNHLMLFYTGVQRVASDIAKSQIENIPNRKKELSDMHAMVNEGVNILFSERSILEFGKLLDQSWQIKRTLSNKVTNPEIDEIYQAARGAGAVGGKLLGAGSGGFMLFLVPPEKQMAVKEKLKKLVNVKFNLSDSGSSVIFYRKD